MINRGIVFGILAIFGATVLPVTGLAQEGFACPVKQSVVRILVEGESLYHDSINQSGTAFFVSRDGYLLTAFHVVGKNEPNGSKVIWKTDEYGNELRIITAEIPNGRGILEKSSALLEVVDFDELLDVALLKIAGDHYPSVVCRATAVPEDSTVKGFGWRPRQNVYDTIYGRLVPADPADIGDRLQILGGSVGGHSGGPIFDESGRVIGVITSGREGHQGRQGETYATSIRNLIALLPERSRCKQTAVQEQTRVPCQATARDDWTTVLRISDLQFGNKGHNLAYRELLIAANFSQRRRNQIRWGSPDKVGKFSRYAIQARRFSVADYYDLLELIEGESTSFVSQGIGAERSAARDIEAGFLAFRKLGEEIGFISRVGDEKIVRGDTTRIMSNTARVEGIPGGIGPDDPGSPNIDFVAVMIDWATTRDDLDTQAESMNILHLYDTQRAIMRVRVDKTLAIDPTTVNPDYFQHGDEPVDKMGDVRIQKSDSEIVMDLVGLERESKSRLTWGWLLPATR